MEDVGGRCDEDGGRLKDDDVLKGNECLEVVYDCCLSGFCLLW